MNNRREAYVKKIIAAKIQEGSLAEEAGICPGDAIVSLSLIHISAAICALEQPTLTASHGAHPTFE